MVVVWNSMRFLMQNYLLPFQSQTWKTVRGSQQKCSLFLTTLEKLINVLIFFKPLIRDALIIFSFREDEV